MKTFSLLASAVAMTASSLTASEIDDLKAKLAELEARQEVLAEEMETKNSSPFSKTHLGGYGELHYNNLNGEGGASSKKEIDFHRFVLMINHEFSERVTLHTELELEHSLAGEGKNGEVELEQAYVDIALNDDHYLKAGLFLMPVGLLNETHEPETFYGVERNNIEKNIIPTTWWEAGLGATGHLSDNWSYDVALHSGLKTSAANSFKPRNGRQKVSEADASNFAGTLRLRWTPMPNLQTSIVGQYQDDISQDSGDGAGSALLINLNAEYTLDKFSIRALYATWNIQGSAVEAVDADSQVGYYVEPAYRISEQWGVFARYGIYDNTVDANDTEKRQMDFGVNYWLNPNVVFKADYQIQDNENDENQDGFNLGVGYSF